MDITPEIMNALQKYLETKTYSDLARDTGLSPSGVRAWALGEATFIRPSNWEKLKPVLRPYMANADIARPSANAANSSIEKTSTTRFVGFPIVSIAAAAANNPAIMPIADFIEDNGEKEFFCFRKGRGGQVILQSAFAVIPCLHGIRREQLCWSVIKDRRTVIWS